MGKVRITPQMTDFDRQSYNINTRSPQHRWDTTYFRQIAQGQKLGRYQSRANLLHGTPPAGLAPTVEKQNDKLWAKLGRLVYTFSGTGERPIIS